MKEFLVFAGIVLAIAIIVAFWPAIVIIAVIALIVFIARKLYQKAEEQKAYERRNRIIREAEEREREEERQRTIEQNKESIIDRIGGYFKGSIPKYRQAYDYTKKLENDEDYYYAVAISALREHEAEIEKSLAKSCENGYLEAANDALDLLSIISRDEEYSNQKENLYYLTKPFETNMCYIQDDQYGQVDYDLLKQIKKIDINECKKHMTDYDIYFLLWILAIKEPFDYYSYKTIYNTVKKLKFRRGDVPVDAILSSVYVANKHAKSLPAELGSHYRKEAEYSVCSMKGTQNIINFASMLCWIDDKELEYFVLKKLYESNILPSKLQDRFKLLEKETYV